MEKALGDLVSIQQALARLEIQYSKEGELDAVEYAQERVAMFSKRAAVVRLGAIDSFWLTAFLNHRVMARLLSEKESGPLRQLVDIRVEEPGRDRHRRSFTLEFEFARNEWFDDTSIVREYRFIENSLMGRQIFAPTIQWKPGMRLTPGPFPLPTSVLEGTDDGNEEEQGGWTDGDTPFSFFQWLESETDDYELGVLIRDEINPHAIELFFGTFRQDLDDNDDDFEEAD